MPLGRGGVRAPRRRACRPPAPARPPSVALRHLPPLGGENWAYATLRAAQTTNPARSAARLGRQCGISTGPLRANSRGGGGGKTRVPALIALAALIAALLAGALLALAPARADGHPDDIELVISIDDSDGIVAPDSEFSVSAALRFTGPHTPWRRLSIADAALRLSGPLRWRSSDSGVLKPADQFVMGGALYTPYNENDRPADDWAKVVALAMHGRTLLVGSNDRHDDDSIGTRGCSLYVFDTWNKRQAALILHRDHLDVDLDAWRDTTNNCFGRGGDGWRGSAVWQESGATSWLFVNARGDDIDGADNVGSLYIFKLDWSDESQYKRDYRDAPLSVTLVKRLSPPQSEFSNMRGSVDVNYSSAVAISADGSTLAVAAQGMNNIGAVYVYTRPDGAGESWGDIEYADGVKLTAAPAPAWGASGTRPFDPDDANACDAYCSRVSSLVEDADASFGQQKIGLSEDGRVLSVAASWKHYPFDTAGGAFSGGTRDAGEAYVFVAPEGGWQAAPEAGGTLIGAGEDASSFDPQLHHSPGPARRITAPTAVLLARPWADATADGWFGHEIAVSADGSTIAASEAGIDSVHIFQRASADDWAGVLLPSATLSSDVSDEWSYGEKGGIEFFYRDASVLLIANSTHDVDAETEDVGAVDVYTRPASGIWVDADASTAERLLDANPGVNAGFGRTVVKDLDYQRLAISRPITTTPHSFGDSYGGGDSGVYLSDGNCGIVLVWSVSERILNCRIDDNGNWVRHTGRRARYASLEAPPIGGTSAEGCAVRFVDGLRTTTCAIALSGDQKRVEILPDAQGTHTISGQVALSVSGVEGAIVLHDSIEVTIGEPPPLAELRLGFATDTRFTTSTADDGPFPSLLAAGETTTLRLQLLDERGAPWDGDGTSALRVTTTAGALSTRFGDGCAVEALAGGRSCSLNTALASDDAGVILVDLRHSGQAAAARVQATVFSAESGATLNSEPLTVILTGPPAALAVAPPAGGLLNIGTSDEGADRDDRDTLTLAVTAADANGVPVPVPPNASFARLTGPDGASVRQGVALEWPLRNDDGEPLLDFHGNRQVRVNVNRAAAQPLANGEYTLEVRAGGLSAEQTFIVSGGAATLTLGELEGTLAVNEQISLTATVLDAEGQPVPDDTPVEWSATDVGIAAVLVQLSADAVTRNGKASARWLVLTPGSTAVRAMSGAAAADVRLLNVAAAMAAAEPPEPPSPADGLRRRSPGLAAWFGEGTTTAAALLADLPGVDSILFWSGNRWLRYALSNGQPTPGSFNFEIPNGAVLYLVD